MSMLTPVHPLTQEGNYHPGLRHVLWILPLSGLLLSLAFPNKLLPGRWGDHPPGWLAWVAILPLLWALLALPPKLAIWGSWLYALPFFLGTLSWMRLFDYLPWLLLAVGLSLTFPLVVWCVTRMALPIRYLPFAFALTMTGMEWLRGQGMFGLSWSEFGASQVEGLPGRIASLGGIYLISFLLLWVEGTLMQMYLARRVDRGLLALTLGVLAAGLLGGWWQTTVAAARWQHQPRAQIFALVQPSIQRGLTPEALVTPITDTEVQRRLQLMLSLSRQSVRDVPVTGDPPIILWAETSLGYPPDTPEIERLLWETHSYLLAGAASFPAPTYAPRNSAFLLGPTGIGMGRYDKRHLVPFGEFVPLRPVVEKLRRMHIIPDVRDNDIQPGTGWTTLTADGHRLGVGICFESTLPSIARAYARRGARYLVYLTNDAWFHQTSGVRQHFNHARFRAMETGLPVIRVAGTGISGFIAPDGRIIEEIPTYACATCTRRIPEGTPGTVNTLCGWLFAPLCFAGSLLLLVRGLFVSRRNSSRKRTRA